ncbi:ATPase, T2SS/T4P/T4SS family [Methylacidimicrobium cyclopophantes]|nr:ATPase, T2SS/T4P/T4SS family [Methylacidimicrobium cyclopophantes]
MLAIATARHWLEESRLPAIQAALAVLPQANAADLLYEQGIIDEEKRSWLQRQNTPPPGEAVPERFVDQWLTEATRQGASDLHLAPYHPPLCRCHGSLRILGPNWRTLSPQQLDRIVERMLPSGAAARGKGISLLYGPDEWRARLTIGRDGESYFLSFRLPFRGPLELGALGVEEAAALTTFSSGLVVLTGGPGQGKSTLFAALARRIHRSGAGRVVLMEDHPEHPWKEEGLRVVRLPLSEFSTESDELLRAAFGLDVDVLLLDSGAFRRNLRLLVEETARTDALVIATLGARGVGEALRELCAQLPKGASRSLLVRTLRAILAQELIPNATGRGRVAAIELFWNVPAAAVALRNAEPEQMESVLRAGGGKHFQPIDDSLWRLFQQGLVGMEAAYARCRYRPQWVERMHPPNAPER